MRTFSLCENEHYSALPDDDGGLAEICCVEGTGNVVEDLEHEGSSDVRKFTSAQHMSVPEIPVPKLRRHIWNESKSFCRFIVGTTFPVVVIFWLFWAQTKTGWQPFGPNDTLDFDLKDCDLWIRFAKLDDVPPSFMTRMLPFLRMASTPSHGVVSFRTWSFLGHGKIVPGDPKGNSSRVKVEVKNDHSSNFFSCDVTIRVGPIRNDFKNQMHALNVKSEGNGKVVVEVAEEDKDDQGSLYVAGDVSISTRYVHLNMKDLHVGGKANFTMEGGSLKLRRPSMSNGMDITATEGTSIHIETTDAPSVDLGNGDAHFANLCHATKTTTKSADIRLSGDATSLVYVYGNGETPRTPECKVKRKAQLAPFDEVEPIKRLTRFLSEKTSAPSMAHVQLRCPNCKQGVWQFLSSKAFLGLNLDWYTLMSAGMLYPRIEEVELSVFGALDSETDEYKLLESIVTKEFMDGWTVCWIPADGGQHLIFGKEAGTHRRRLRPVGLQDTYFSYIALATNIVASICASTFLVLVFTTSVLPFVFQRLRDTQVEEFATHRLRHTGRDDKAWIFACMVEYPSHGVLLNWRRRPEFSLAMGFFIQLESRDGAHQETFRVPKSMLQNSRNNPNMEEYIVRSAFSGGLLKIGKEYKFMLRPIDQDGLNDENCPPCYTALVRVDPPSPITDLPMLLLKAFHAAPIASLERFSSQVSCKSLEIKIQLQWISLEVLPIKLEELLNEQKQFGGGVKMELEWPQDPHIEEVDQQISEVQGVVVPMFENTRKSTREGKHFYTFDIFPLELTLKSMSQTSCLLRMRTTRTMRKVMETELRIKDLLKHWDYQGCDENGSPPIDEEMAKGNAKNKKISIELDGFVLEFVPVLWDNFPYDARKPTPFREMWCPVTPYDSSSWGGDWELPKPITSEEWIVSPFRSIMPSEMVLQGTRKMVRWDHDAMRRCCGGATSFKLELRLIYAESSGLNLASFQKHKKRVWLLADKVSVDSEFMWRVLMNDQIEDRCVLTASSGDKVVASSVEFFVDVPLTLQNFELAYGTYCKAFHLRMDFSDETLKKLGLSVIRTPLAVCQNLRPVLPIENAEFPSKKVCELANSLLPSARPVCLLSDSDDTKGLTYRSAVEEVDVLEGASWNMSLARKWNHDMLLLYHLDYSGVFLSRVSKLFNLAFEYAGLPSLAHVEISETSPLGSIVRTCVEVLVYTVQVLTFCFLPVFIIIMMVWQQYLHAELNPAFRLGTSNSWHIRRRSRLSDWMGSVALDLRYTKETFGTVRVAREVWERQRDEMQWAVRGFAYFIALLWLALFYMNFVRFGRLGSTRITTLIDFVAKRLLAVMLFFALVFSISSLMWLLLACLIVDPQKLAPVAVMFVSAVWSTAKVASTMQKLSESMRMLMKGLVDSMLGDCLDEFIQSKPDLRNALVSNSDQYLYFEVGWKWDKKAEEYTRALAEQAERIPQKASLEINMTVDDDVAMAPEIEANDEAFDLSSKVRGQLDMCFQYMVNKIPLPLGLQKTLQDVQQLAIGTFARRNDALHRLSLRGQDLCVEVARNNIENNLNQALMDVLKDGPTSKINVLDAEQTKRDCYLFYDKTLFELIRTHVRSTMALKYEELCRTIKTKMRKVKIGVSTPTELRQNLLKELYAIGLLSPGDWRNLDDDTSPILKKLQRDVMQVTGGEGIMNMNQLISLVTRMVDTERNGKIDHLWHACYRDFLEELYLVAPRRHIDVDELHKVRVRWKSSAYDSGELILEGADSSNQECRGWVIEAIVYSGKLHSLPEELKDFAAQYPSLPNGCSLTLLRENIVPDKKSDGNLNEWGFPVSAQKAEEAWNSETQNEVMLNLERIEDVILSKLTTLSGVRKLWPEAFVLLARFLHIWPEVPYEDACAYILGSKPEFGGPDHYSFGEAEFGPTKPANAATLMVKVCTLEVEHSGRTSTFNYFSTISWDLEGEGKSLKVDGALLRKSSTTSIGTSISYSDFPEGASIFAYSTGRFSAEDAYKKKDEAESKAARISTATARRSTTARMSKAGEANKEDGPKSPRDGLERQVSRMSEGAMSIEMDFLKDDNQLPGTFESLGSFSPSDGYAFLQTSWESLREAYKEPEKARKGRVKEEAKPWVTLVWDPDAQQFPKTPPFEGPLEVFIIFYNLDPKLTEDEIHRSRSWVKSWRREESLVPPTIRGGSDKWKGFRTKKDPPLWAADRSDEEPRHEIRSKMFDINDKGRNDAKIYQMGVEDDTPVLIFVRTSREQFPDVNSFKPAHEAPFLRSDFFNDLWSKMDKKEAIVRAELAGSVPPTDPQNTWFIDLAPDGIDLLQHLVMDEDMKGASSGRNNGFRKDLKKLGENFLVESEESGNSMWFEDGPRMLRLRGLWFDAFEELLASIGMEMDRRSAWCLWRKFTSTKEVPVVSFDGGFVPIRVRGEDFKSIEEIVEKIRKAGKDANNLTPIGAIDALEYLVMTKPFLSDSTFLEFNKRANLHLDEDIAKRLYKRFCDATPRYEGAKNLILFADFDQQLKDHILKRTHTISLTPEGERESASFYVGGIWFEPLYNVIITSMPEVPPWDKVKELYGQYVNAKTGLCPLENVYDIIAKLGRPGLKKEQFNGFVQRLGMHVDPETLLRCFNRVDIEQNNVLDADEMKSGMNLLFQEMVPELILRRNGLMPDQVAMKVLGFLTVLVMIYVFLDLSFKTLVGPDGGGKLNAIIQSALAGGVALMSQRRNENQYDETRTRDQVSSSLGHFVGSVAHRSLAKDKVKKA